jgi:RNA polymerase sigma-70 factor (ECF subfamily)
MEDRSPTTSSLIRAARDGQTEVLENLLEWYRDHLRVLARRALDSAIQSKTDSSDLVQETLIKAYENFPQFRGETEGELVSWLHRILAYNVADHIRRFRIGASRTVTRERSLDEILGQTTKIGRSLMADSQASPIRQAEDQEVRVRLVAALAQLRPDHRQVIVLRSLQDLDWKQVGRHLHRSAEAARLLWNRAIENLRNLIADWA